MESIWPKAERRLSRQTPLKAAVRFGSSGGARRVPTPPRQRGAEKQRLTVLKHDPRTSPVRRWALGALILLRDAASLRLRSATQQPSFPSGSKPDRFRRRTGNI